MESLVRVQMEGKGAKQEQEVLGLKVTSSKTVTAGVPGHSAALVKKLRLKKSVLL